ncbi:MAG: hypothetical protein OZ921_09155 [Sorangiineae bacterium]|nr:hypothetical protein [Polyangiaceae bacterium]MEB2322670.1 hypothetical protein [Sorangiineae bacterium]
MNERSPAADPQLPAETALDPDLEALPEPRRPGRTLTLLVMAVTATLALLLAYALRGEAAYALERGAPLELGELDGFTPRAELANRWVRGEAPLGSNGALRYGRPLDGDTFRLAPVGGNDRLWVEVRVPAELDDPRFVPPSSFVGRLVPFRSSGLGHAGLPDAVAEAASPARVPADAWVLIDDQSPRGTRWALGLVALLLGFAGFNLWGLYQLTRPVS